MNLRAFVVCLAIFTTPCLAQAQISLVTTRPALGGTDFINWSVLGPDSTQVNNPFNILSNNSVNVNVSESPGQFMRLDQGTGWGGNFSPGDALLYTGTAFGLGTGPITLNFGTSTTAFGANIQSDDFGTFVARLSFFDASNTLVGTITEQGNSTGDGDGSAIFIGGISGSPATNFFSVVVSLDSSTSDPADFAINQADFSLAAVPEPTTWALIGVVTLGTGAYTWKKRQQAIKNRFAKVK